MYGVEVVTLPDSSDLDEETIHVCEQFRKYHKANCAKAIVKDLKWVKKHWFGGGGKSVMVFNATCNNISVISWHSVSLLEETGVPGKNHQPVASHWQTLLHNVVSSTPHH